MQESYKSELFEKKTIFGKEVSVALKGLLVILMFWAHMFAHPDRIWEGVEWISMGTIAGKTIEEWLVPFFHIAVPLFFFISGYGFYAVSKKNAGYKFKNLRNQLVKLYTKYWLVFVIAIPIAMAMGKLSFEPVEFILNFIGFDSSYCGEWWFLGTYVLILISFYLCYRLYKIVNEKWLGLNNKWGGIILIISSLVIATVGYGGNWLLGRAGFDTNNLVWHQCYYLLIKQPMFVIGYIFARYNLLDKICFWVKGLALRFKLPIWLIIIACLILLPYLSFIPETYLYVFYTPIFCFCFCALFVHLHRYIKNVFTFLGKFSTYMWLTHSLLLYKFIQPIIYLPKISVVCWLWLIVLSLTVAIIFTYFEKALRFGLVYITNTIRNKHTTKGVITTDEMLKVESSISEEDKNENHSSSADEIK